MDTLLELKRRLGYSGAHSARASLHRSTRHMNSSTTAMNTYTTQTEAPTTHVNTTTVMTSQNNGTVTTESMNAASNGQSGPILVVLVIIPVIVLAVLLLMLIGFYWMKSTARFRKRRNRNSTSGNEEVKVEDLEAGKGKTNGQTETPFNNYTDAGKQSGIKSKSNGNETKNTPAGQYEEVDNDKPKTKIGGSQGYEEVSNNKTPLYHTLEPDSTSNEAVTSHQDVGYDQLDRGDPSSKANVNASTSAGYDQLNATSKKNTYDLLNRESRPISQNDVIDANEYSELNEKISSTSASYDKLNHKAELSGSIEAVTSPQDVGYDQLDRGDPSSKANVNASTSAGYDQLNATPKSNSYDLLNKESRPASQNDVIDANEYSELNEKISSASASYDKLNHKAELSGSIEAVTSPQDVGYDQLNRGDPSSKANVNASTSAGYEQLNATSKKNSYDLLNRESKPASQNDVIDANEYSELNEQITSASASYDKLDHKAEISGSIEAVTSHQDVGYDQLDRGDPSSKANVNASTSAGYDQLNATPKSNSYDLLNRESRPASQNDVIDANEYSELNGLITSASASYDKLDHKAKISGSIEVNDNMLTPSSNQNTP